MNFGSFGGSDGLVMRDGPETTGFVCVVSVYGLEKGESISI